MPLNEAIRGPSSTMRSSGTFHTPMPLAEKPARRWNRIAATRRSARRSRIDSRCSKSCAWETPSSAAGAANGSDVTSIGPCVARITATSSSDSSIASGSL